MNPNTHYQLEEFNPGNRIELACETLQDVHEAQSVQGVSLSSDVGKAVAEEKILDAGFLGSLSEESDTPWHDRVVQVQIGRSVLKDCVECEFFSDCPAIGFIEDAADIPTMGELALQKLQIGLAQELTQRHGDSVIVTGGVALRLHGIPRSTSDLDIDFAIPHVSTLDSLFDEEADGEVFDLKQDVAEFMSGDERQEFIEDYEISVKKDTESKVKLNLGYKVKNAGTEEISAGHMKFEVEFIDEEYVDLDEDTEIINGVRVYTLEKLFDNKVETISERVKVRDYADITYILEKKPDLLEELPDTSLELLRERFSEVLDALTDDKKDISDYFDDYVQLPSWLRSNKKFADVLFGVYESIDSLLEERHAAIR